MQKRAYMNFDKYQMEVITSNDNILLIAGPGSGKTTTILEKVNYLLKSVSENDILLLSFTNKSVEDIKKRLKANVLVTTFHKLAIDVLKTYKYPYNICEETLLPYIIDEYFKVKNKKEINRLCRYLGILKLNYYNDDYISFKRLIITFINLFKTNDYNINTIYNLVNNYNDKYLLKIILEIFMIYENEKKSTNTLDFDDLIIIATKLLKDNYKYKKFKYIIVDEFQDTSAIRLNLIREIYNNSSSIITAVGDDAQSIFHFSGCDLNIFLNFNKYFNNAKTLFLHNTYRNSEELINISSLFIEKNPIQLKKNMHSNIHINKPIEIIYYKNGNNKLKSLIDSINDNNILILSRNKKDIYNYLDNDITFINNEIHYKNNVYKYLTIHSAKGLEANYVIVLNCSNNILGIPNKIENHPILNYLDNNDETIPYAEERRIFFVAITRCKIKTFLMVPKDNPSIFIKEIKNLSKDKY